MICFSWYILWKFIQLLYFSNTAQIISKAVGDQITLITWDSTLRMVVTMV